MVIGAEISSILNWKFPQDIDLSRHEGPYSLDSQLYLLEVYYQLKSRNIEMMLSDV